MDDVDEGERGEVAPCDRDHAGAEVDGEDPIAPLGEGMCGLSGPAADLEDSWRPSAGPPQSEADRVEDGVGVGRASPDIEQCVIIERMFH